MALEMRAACGKCGRTLGIDDEAYICSYECTFVRAAPSKCSKFARIAAANCCEIAKAR